VGHGGAPVPVRVISCPISLPLDLPVNFSASELGCVSYSRRATHTRAIIVHAVIYLRSECDQRYTIIFSNTSPVSPILFLTLLFSLMRTGLKAFSTPVVTLGSVNSTAPQAEVPAAAPLSGCVAERPFRAQLKTPEFIYIYVFTIVHMVRFCFQSGISSPRPAACACTGINTGDGPV
jgi:hypothetical protein